MAVDYEDVFKGKYPGKLHAKKVADIIKSQGGAGAGDGVIYLEAQKSILIEDTDRPVHFTQRRHFFYVTGCELADCYYTYDMKTEKATLFIPPIDPDEVTWSGLPLTREEAMEKFDIDDCQHVTDLNAFLTATAGTLTLPTVYAIPTQISPTTTFLAFTSTNLTHLKPAIDTSRVRKTPYEVALISAANRITHAAHLAVLRAAPRAATESHLHAAFVSECLSHGAKELAYSPIVAAGTAAATLHYVANDAPLAGKQLLLLDAGAELRCHASDVTRTFPLSGAFSPEARAVYDVVLRMQAECLEMIRPGVRWEAVHERAHRVAIAGLQRVGVLRADADPEEVFGARTSAAFFPHGLGHHLGLDTHDVGGNPDYEDADPMFRYLRIRGEVPEGAVVTVEPGVYFCRYIVEPYVKSAVHGKFIDAAVLERFWDVGGVRIEDNVVVREGGVENLTTVPKGAEEMERIVRGEEI